MSAQQKHALRVDPSTNGGARGGWKHVRPEEIRAYRKEHGLSRAKLAEALGVSTTSIQNWEAGRAAAPATQRRLRTLIDGKPLPPLEGQKKDPTKDAIVSVTGQIVAAYVSTQRNLDPSEVTELIRNVKAALTD